jgi:hypothetical protein
MRLQPFAYRLTASAFLGLGLLVNSAIADTPGACGSVPMCAPTCGSPGDSGAPCIVRISHNGTLATATTQNLAGGPGSPNADICVSAGTVILWFTLEDKSKFNLDFGSSHAFAHSAKFHGDNEHPASDETIPQSGDGPASCYQYSIKHCIGHDCGTADPKVIVNGVRLLNPAASSQHPNK